MCSRASLVGAVGLLLCCAPQEAGAQAQDGFTYQGVLNDNGFPFTGQIGMRFALYNSPESTSPVAGPTAVQQIEVEDGLFNAVIGFPESALAGGVRYLEITIDPGGPREAVLSPRTAITPTPSATQAAGASVDGTGTVRFQSATAGIELSSASDITDEPALNGSAWQSFRPGEASFFAGGSFEASINTFGGFPFWNLRLGEGLSGPIIETGQFANAPSEDFSFSASGETALDANQFYTVEFVTNGTELEFGLGGNQQAGQSNFGEFTDLAHTFTGLVSDPDVARVDPGGVFQAPMDGGFSLSGMVDWSFYPSLGDARLTAPGLGSPILSADSISGHVAIGRPLGLAPLHLYGGPSLITDQGLLNGISSQAGVAATAIIQDERPLLTFSYTPAGPGGPPVIAGVQFYDGSSANNLIVGPDDSGDLAVTNDNAPGDRPLARLLQQGGLVLEGPSAAVTVLNDFASGSADLRLTDPNPTIRIENSGNRVASPRLELIDDDGVERRFLVSMSDGALNFTADDLSGAGVPLVSMTDQSSVFVNTAGDDPAELGTLVVRQKDDSFDDRENGISLVSDDFFGGLKAMRFYIENGTDAHIDAGNGGQDILQLNEAGGAVLVGGSLVQTSRRALKQDIEPLRDSIETILSLRGVSYRWSDERGGKADIGFIAEEMAQVLPEIVSFDDEGSPVGIDYGRVTALLVEAVKEQQMQMRSMEQRLERVERALLELDGG
ncbi:MAG: tail fiber domain-containing protein, partial [Phycisphaerales bacterium]